MGGDSSPVRACLCVLIVFGSWNWAGAQIGAGSIAGTLVDQAGAAVPGATVTLIAVGTNATRRLVTGPDGVYVAPALAPGAYRVRVESGGFRPLTRDGVRVATGETVRVDLRLEVGGLAEAVTVTADAPLLRQSRRWGRSSMVVPWPPCR